MEAGALELILILKVWEVLEMISGHSLGLGMLTVFRHPPSAELYRRFPSDGIDEGNVRDNLIVDCISQDVKDIGIALDICLGEAAHV